MSIIVPLPSACSLRTSKTTTWRRATRTGRGAFRVQEALGWARSRAERVVVRYFAREGQPVRLLGGYAAAVAVCRATAHLASRRPRPALATDAWA